MKSFQKEELDEILNGVTNVEIFDKNGRLFCTISKYKFDGAYRCDWSISMFGAMNLNKKLEWVPIESIIKKPSMNSDDELTSFHFGMPKKKETNNDSVLQNFHWGTLEEAYHAIKEKMNMEESR